MQTVCPESSGCHLSIFIAVFIAVFIVLFCAGIIEIEAGRNLPTLLFICAIVLNLERRIF